VARVESAADFFPDDVAAKIPVVSALRKDGKPLAGASFTATQADPKAFVTALEETIGLLQEDTVFTLRTLGKKDLVPRVQRVAAAAASLRDACKAVQPDRLAHRLTAYEEELSVAVRGLTRMLNAPDRPFQITDLPRSLIGPFYRMEADGEYFGTRVYPAGSIADPPYVSRLRKALVAIDEGATGHALVFSYFAVIFAEGLQQSVIWATLAVLLLVWFDMRSLRDTLLALLPLLIGGVWMVGLMEVFSVEWTFANGVSMALIIGIGVDSGVHLVHRWRENGRDVRDATRTSGKAIMVSSFTTMIAFGSMSLARYQGLHGLGIVLLLGVGSCLFATLVILPGVLYLVGPKSATDG